jgi:hypothetical protein
VKLTKQGAGQPGKEPLIDEPAYKKMMAHYYKKQEEQKQLEEDNDDAYVNSAWANPSQLKNQLNGISDNVQWRAGR